MHLKRWLAIILALVLAFSLLGGILPTVFSAEAYTIGLRDSENRNKLAANPGDSLEIYLYLAGNPGMVSVGALLECSAGMEITGAESALSGHNFTPVWQYSREGTKPFLVWMLIPTGTEKGGLVTYNGNWCKLTIALSETIAPGEYTIRLTAPKDKNITAQTAGGVIQPNTNRYITDVAVSNLTVSVGASQCNHSWDSWAEQTAADCEAAGKLVRVCQNCQQEEVAVLPALGHNFDKPEIVRQPTADTPGLQQSKCSRCDAVEEKEILYTEAYSPGAEKQLGNMLPWVISAAGVLLLGIAVAVVIAMRSKKK